MPQTSRLPSGDGPLFVYGTLRYPQVLRALLGRVPAGEPATLDGWRAAALEGRPYPGLIRARGATAHGVLLDGLTPREWHALDAFEGEEYALDVVTVTGGRRAQTYVWRGGDVHAEDWDADAYAARCLAAYAPPRA